MNSIYAITPPNVNLEDLIKKIKYLLDLGIDTFQYRSKDEEESVKKNAAILLEVIKNQKGKLIINDFPEIALEIGADGFHLGEEDYLNKKNQNFLRKHSTLINENYITGLSCKWNLELLKNPPEEVIDWNYLAVGSFFESKTKQDISLPPHEGSIKKALQISNRPIYAIGGINSENIMKLKMIGYERFAISRGLFSQEKNRIENILKINNEKN